MTKPGELPPDRGMSQEGIVPLNKDDSGSTASIVTPSGMGDSGGSKTVKKMRTFEQIVADEKENRNILEIIGMIQRLSSSSQEWILLVT